MAINNADTSDPCTDAQIGDNRLPFPAAVCGLAQPNQRTVIFKGERRVKRLFKGAAERFSDPEGQVCGVNKVILFYIVCSGETTNNSRDALSLGELICRTQ